MISVRMRSSGLSPRVRGNHDRVRGGRSADGSIPACAGEPSNDRRAGFLIRVYPRVCGGTNIAMAISRTIRGLSPRVRGNP